MVTLTEQTRDGEFLLSEGEGFYSRDTVTILANTPAMVSGTLVGRITATGKYANYNNAATNGTEVATGVLYTGTEALTIDQNVVVIRRTAEVAGAKLVGADASGLADLLAAGVVVR
jgi:hypothetical protein